VPWLKERLASLGELSAGIAHEIRNPLTGIGASAQLLKGRLAGEEGHVRLTDLILDEVARLDRIVENMLEFASPAQPRFRLQSVTACLEKAVELVREEAESSDVLTDVRFDEVPKAWIDPDQMEQVFLNLLKNAIQAMEDSGGDLKLGVRHVERPTYVRRQAGRREEDRGRLEGGKGPLHSWVEVEITDTGHGMTPGEVERIFNPFYTTRRRGTGLGLSITQSIVQEHGGMISVTSTPGRGTTVLVDLPEDRRRGSRRGAAPERKP
jgi:signal transduction histidine kinase